MLFDLNKYGEEIAFVSELKSYTYKQLLVDTLEFASQVGPRNLIFIVAENVYASAMAYIASLNNDIVPLMLDSNIDIELFLNLVDIYKPNFVWMPKDFGFDIENRYMCKYVFENYELRVMENEAHELNPELALLISTSGSTGSPKLVRQSYHNIKVNTESIVSYLEIDNTEVAITSLPMNYVYGLSVLNSHIYSGGKVVLTENNPYSKVFWNLFDSHNVTSFAGVPFTYEMLDKLRFTKTHKHLSLKTLTQAGGKLSPELHDKYAVFAHNNGIRFVVMYGASEATARMGYLPYTKSIEKKGSMGIAIPGGRFELLDEAGSVINEPGVVGELVYYGANVTHGYAENLQDLMKEDENNGCLVTGDLSYMDEEGYYYIVGRKKRFLKMLGKRVNLEEIENMIKNHFQVIEVACTGKDDLLIICHSENLNKDEIRAYVSEMSQLNKNMIEAVYVSEIPKNPAGKIMYADLLAKVEEMV